MPDSVTGASPSSPSPPWDGVENRLNTLLPDGPPWLEPPLSPLDPPTSPPVEPPDGALGVGSVRPPMIGVLTPPLVKTGGTIV